LVRTGARTISRLYVLTSIERLYFPSWEIPLVLGLGVLSALAGSWVPARAAAALPPLRALSLHGSFEHRWRPRLASIGVSAFLLALAGLSSWLAFAFNRLAGFAAAFFVLAGFCALSSLVTGASGRWFAWAARPIHTWRLAAQNLVRSVRHHAVTVAALAAALAMLVSVSVMIFSFRATVNRWIQRRLVADIFVTPVQNEVIGFQNYVAPDFFARLRQLPQVEAVDAYRDMTVTAAGQRVSLGVVIGSVRSMPEFLGGHDQEKFARFLARGEVIISEPLSRRLHLKEGDHLNILTPAGERLFRIAGVYYDYTRDAGAVLMQRENFLRSWHEEGVHSLALYLRRGTDPEAVINDIRQREPAARFYALRANANLRRLVNSIFDQTFAVTYALRLVAALVAVIGIVLNLTVLVKERERELAIMRSLGALRGQVMGMILAEAVLLSLVALALGLGAGCVLAVVLTEVINKAFFGWTIPLEFPWEQLALAPFLLVPVSLLGGLWPAWRAANVPITDAIRTVR
ncbi:MAG: ABC transporter permease, partial [Verrucomicrobia bacterium]|nr:ABC transporter permease [Verrucomicrobiota bacterium]